MPMQSKMPKEGLFWNVYCIDATFHLERTPRMQSNLSTILDQFYRVNMSTEVMKMKSLSDGVLCKNLDEQDSIRVTKSTFLLDTSSYAFPSP